MSSLPYTTLFLDIGGVILTNGWDHALREKAAKKFDIDFVEMNKRHGVIFDTFEIGKITFDGYLERVIFYKTRNFSLGEFKNFIFSQSQAFPDMIQWIKELKLKHSLKIIALSNEGKELMIDRIKKFQLNQFIDFFVCSGFMGLRKPDHAIYHMAMSMSHALPKEVIYMDDRPILIEVGQSLGLQAIQHVSFEQTKSKLKSLGID